MFPAVLCASEIPDYRPTSGLAYYFPSVYANRISVAYFGGNPHLGQWSFDLWRSKRLTLPLGPLLVSTDPPLVSDFFLSLGTVHCHNSTNHPSVHEGGPCSLVGISWLCARHFHKKSTPAPRSVADPSSEPPPVTIGRTGRVVCLLHHRPPGFRSSVPVSPCAPPISFVPESESHSADFRPRNHSSP